MNEFVARRGLRLPTLLNSPLLKTDSEGNVVMAVAGTDFVAPSTLTNYVLTSRTLTINGVSFDLTANRSWTIPTHDAVTLGVNQNGLSLAGQVLSLGLSSSTTNGALSSSDWVAFNNKQNALNGTGFVRLVGTTLSYISGTASQFVMADGTLSSNPGWLTTETDPTVPSHVKAITTTDISNWNTAFGWGNHAGLYRPISYVPTWTEVSGRPTALSAFTNDVGFITGINSTMVTNALGFTPYNSSNPSGFITGINSSMVTTALGYTPVQPNGTGASGTWGISITGNAATVGGLSPNVSIGTVSNIVARNAAGEIYIQAPQYTSGVNRIAAWNASSGRIEYYEASQVQSILGLGSYAYRSSGLAELSGANFMGAIGGTSLSMSGTGYFGDNISLAAGKRLQFSSTAYITPEDNIQGARIVTGGGFIVESSSVTASGIINANAGINIASGNNLTWGGQYGANIPTIAAPSGSGAYLAFYPTGSTLGEVARFSSAGNLLIRTTTDNGVDALQVNGSGSFTGSVQINSTLNTESSTSLARTSGTLTVGGTFSPIANTIIDARGRFIDGETVINATAYGSSGSAAINGTSFSIFPNVGGNAIGVSGQSIGSRTAGVNIGGYFTATGAPNNWGIYVDNNAFINGNTRLVTVGGVATPLLSLIQSNNFDGYYFSIDNLVDGRLELRNNSNTTIQTWQRATGAVTFSSSVTASSFIVSGGTNSQALMANGSTRGMNQDLLTTSNVTFNQVTATNGGFNSDINDKTAITHEHVNLSGLRGANYLRISTQQKEYGYIAQEVQKFLPEAVYEAKNGLAVSYHMVNAARIDYIQDEVSMLKDRVKQLEDRIIKMGGAL